MASPPLIDQLSSYSGLLLLATLSIYAGSSATLPTGSRSQAKGRQNKQYEDDDERIERLSSGDAWLFPFMAGCVLVGLYLAMRYFGREWINWFIGWYVAFTGILAVWKSTTSLVRFLTPRHTWNSFRSRRLVFRGAPYKSFSSISFRIPELLLLLLSAIPSILYISHGGEKRPALLNNILALSFSHTALSMLRIDSFKTGVILLTGLFFYDIFFVFGTDVMVSVATGLDIPAKLVWPRSLVFATDSGFSMLGLGDIAIPGTFVSLALRYDYHRSDADSADVPFKRPFFRSVLFAYVCGLTTAIFAAHAFSSAQPALLYLSPACILSFVMTAVTKGEFNRAWAYQDGVKPEEKTQHSD